ncbi:YfiR family protein [Pandoraea sp. NPDC087047]|uniref:YfiR family protein n=1 Tax=Pandoraea sp. NPDC087047 TaxID=3364390 RepID=UPI00381E8049
MTQGLWRARREVLHWHARPTRWGLPLLPFLFLLCVVAMGSAMAQTPAASPAVPVNAAASASSSARDANVRQVVLGIISFTRWPTPPAKVRLCVIGSTDYARDLLAGPQSVQSAITQPVEAQRISGTEPAIGSLCDALYLGAMGDTERRQILTNLAGHPVLTISERNDSCTAGTMFCLNVDADRVTFDINLDTVARSGVRVHPNVLKLARKPGTP